MVGVAIPIKRKMPIQVLREPRIRAMRKRCVFTNTDYNHQPAEFNRKPSSEKEAFAHKYADRLRTALEKRGVIPFERVVSARSLEQDKLRMSDNKKH